jgi:hypothetical protein
MADDLAAQAFEARYRELLRQMASAANEGSVECHGCRACSRCTFCRDSDRLVRCHYCVRCATCTDCSHCRDGRSLVACNHCIDCESCTKSSYLVRSVGLASCAYCFGCVGLSGRDFHILNEPYERSEYFRIADALARRLRLGSTRAE